LFNLAISAYMSYQWSHSPRTNGRLFFYDFVCAGYPVFVLDTRTQRFKDDQTGLRDNHMLGRPSLDKKNHPSQLDLLLAWLTKQQQEVKDAPKFIVSSSVFAPNDMSERIEAVANDAPGAATDPLYLANVKRREASDSWPAYPNTRAALLAHIVQNKIQNVILLGGDIHCSCLADISFDGGGKGLRMCAVTSSAFYWPFPFADGDPNGYVHDSRQQIDPFPIPGTNATMNYTAFGFTQEDNFTRIELDRAKATLTIRVYDRKGEALEAAGPDGEPTKANVLKLANW
jgi:alkaline phosphatase D